MLKKSLPLLLCLSLSVSSVSAAELTANQAVTTQTQTQAPPVNTNRLNLQSYKKKPNEHRLQKYLWGMLISPQAQN